MRIIYQFFTGMRLHQFFRLYSLKNVGILFNVVHSQCTNKHSHFFMTIVATTKHSEFSDDTL